MGRGELPSEDTFPHWLLKKLDQFRLNTDFSEAKIRSILFLNILMLNFFTANIK